MNYIKTIWDLWNLAISFLGRNEDILWFQDGKKRLILASEEENR